MANPGAVGPAVFILDCDDTLLDNDALKDDLDAHLRALLGDPLVERFWQVYEDVRTETGAVDYPLTLARFRPALPDETTLARVDALIMDYPFATCVYPGALDALAHLRAIAFPTIVSDGDSVYQPRKIARSGLAAAVDGHVLIYVHKEEHLDEVMARWPAPFYVMVDDKARILSATKQLHPDRFVTVHVRQGHYGRSPDRFPVAPDLTIERIGDLRALDLADLHQHLTRAT
jgi:FMN phosphatase YigB (HAD superfamily)